VNNCTKDIDQNALYYTLDPSTAAAMRKDDEEIMRLEKNLGLTYSIKHRKKLNKEYSRLEGYGNDFGNFLDSLDDIHARLKDGKSKGLEYDNEYDFEDTKTDVSQRAENLENLSDDFSYDENTDENKDFKDTNDSSFDTLNDDDDDISNDCNSESEQSTKVYTDHNEETYRPAAGQDLYGNYFEPNDGGTLEPKKYVPPHLRKQEIMAASKELSGKDNMSRMRKMQQLMNKSLNRITDNTLESVTKFLSTLYLSNEYSTNDLNDVFWKNIQSACIMSHIMMSGLIPVYIACVSGVHFQTGDFVGAYVLERVVFELWGLMKKHRKCSTSTVNKEAENGQPPSKESSNLMLILCYLHNFSVVHNTLIYDIIRYLINHFTEKDVELLLIVLKHCGYQLRVDDPGALKDIVNLVQNRSLSVINSNKEDKDDDYICMTPSSRLQHIIAAINDLKSNKRSKSSVILGEKAVYYRKVIGRMKTATTLISGTGRSSSGASLRITLKDILEIEAKGRWWKIGSSWTGNQFRGDDNVSINKIRISSGDRSQEKVGKKEKNNKLLTLASKQQMNTDLRRSVFCIIVGSHDCQDAFEKIVKAGMLQGKSEREVVRVIVHCCGHEKVYNAYYSHLASRVCVESKSKFTFQLTFWDVFRQFENMAVRKAANLAKMLAHLLTANHLNLNIIKVIDMLPDEMPEAAIIFMTILFTDIFEKFDDHTEVTKLFQKGENGGRNLQNDSHENAFGLNDREALKENISVFLLHFMAKHPKNVKKSQFQRNMKAALKACENNNLNYVF